MTTKKELCYKALTSLYLELPTSIADDIWLKVRDALEEATINTEKAEELWDSYSEHIDSDIDSLQTVAGTTIMRRSQFMKMFENK